MLDHDYIFDFKRVIYNIETENYDDFKKIIVEMYRSDVTIDHEKISDIIVGLSIKERFDLIDFIMTVFSVDFKKLTLNKIQLTNLFLLSGRKGLDFIMSRYSIENFTNNLDICLSRGSLFVLKKFENDHNVIIKNMIKELIFLNFSNEYIDHLRRKVGDYYIFSSVVERINSGHTADNIFLKYFIEENKDIFYLQDHSKNNFLHLILKSENYEIIDFVLRTFPFMLNDLNDIGYSPMMKSFVCANSDTFEILWNAQGTIKSIFDKDINNVLHLYVKKEDIYDKEKKFNIIKSDINDVMLLTKNKKGETAYSLLVRDNYISELSYIFSHRKEKTDIENANFDINDIEKYVILGDIVAVSHILYKSKSNSRILSQFNKSTLMNKASLFEVFMLLFEYGINVNGISPCETKTPIMSAIENKDVNSALFFLKNKCEINTVHDGLNCIIMAANNKMDDLIYFLLKEKIDVPINHLKGTVYEKWMSLADLETQKLSVVIFNEKKSLFRKKSLSNDKFSILKSDDDNIKAKKNILNAYYSSENILSFFQKLENFDIKSDLVFDKNKFKDVVFFYKSDTLFLGDLGIKRENFKQKLHYNYFKVRKLI